MSNLQDYETFGFAKQEIPEYLNQRKGESLDTWRDRLYHQYRLPVVLAALSDIKLPYVEIVNPLLTGKIIDQVRTVHDHLRTEKEIFKRIVREISPKVDFASIGSIENAQNIFKLPEVVNLMVAELSKPYMETIFPKEFLSKIIIKLKNSNQDSKTSVTVIARLKSFAKQIMPMYLKDKFRSNISKPPIDNNKIAFRMYMAGKMHEIFSEDALLVHQPAIVLT